MGCIDHIDIISSITNPKSGTFVFPHQPNHILFLFWGNSAANNRLTQINKLKQLILLSNPQQIIPCDNQTAVPALRIPQPHLKHLINVPHPLDNSHIIRNKPTRDANIDSSFLLITRKHPNLNASISKSLNSLFNIILQSILDSSSPQQNKLLLHNFFQLLCICTWRWIILELA